MKRICYHLLALAGSLLLAIVPAAAQGAGENAIEAMTVAQQGGVLNVRLTFKDALGAPPSGFSVAARRASRSTSPTRSMAWARVSSTSTKATCAAPILSRSRGVRVWFSISPRR